MKSTILIASAVAGLLVLASCERDCDWTSTDIRVYREWVGERLYLDTFVNPAYLYFETSEKVDSVVWQIGDDPRERSGNPLELTFPEIDAEIEVRATAYGGCLDGTPAQQSKTIWVLPLDKSPLIGKYRVYDTQTPEDTFTIEIFHWKGYLYMANFPKLCDEIELPLLAYITSPYSYGFSTLDNKDPAIVSYRGENRDAEYYNPFTPDLGCYIDSPYFGSVGQLSEDRNTLTIDYQLKDSQGELTQRQAIATRIE